jgi:hypothetical protein
MSRESRAAAMEAKRLAKSLHQQELKEHDRWFERKGEALALLIGEIKDGIKGIPGVTRVSHSTVFYKPEGLPKVFEARLEIYPTGIVEVAGTQIPYSRDDDFYLNVRLALDRQAERLGYRR